MPAEPTLAVQQLTNELKDRIVKDKIPVPMLPEVANQVISLSQSSDSDAQQLAQLIQSDPSLAAHVMHIANSAAYTPNATLVSLQQAITRLGMNLICDIAVAASISSKMFDAPGYENHIERTWRHALLTALWSKEIARKCRLNVEATFLCGLLHTIGKPVVLQASIEICSQQNIDPAEGMLLAIEADMNIEAGSCVLRRWGMPVIVCEALQYFHHYNDAPHAKEQTAIINAAAQFALHTMDSELLDSEALQDLEVLSDLNLYPDEVAELLECRDNIVSSMEAMSRP